MTINNTTGISKAPLFTLLNNSPKAPGILATIPANIIKEIPFPTPFSVIRSPIHIKIRVPTVVTITVEK